jgi:alpha-glucosidase
MRKRFLTAIIATSFVLLTSLSHAATIGNVKEWRETQNAVTLKCDGADVVFSFVDGDILKIEVLGERINSKFPSLLSLENGPSPRGARMLKSEKKIVSGDMTLKITEKPFSFEFTNGDKTLLRLVPGGIEWKNDGSYKISFMREKGDAFLGLGEQLPDPIGAPIKMDYKRRVRAIWNRHVPPSDMGLPVYYNPVGYGLYVDNPWKAEFNFSDNIVYSAFGGPIRFYVFNAPDAFKMLDQYTSVTGKPPIPPRWAAGYMQSRYGYSSEKDYRWLMTNFRDRKIPCDTLIFDLDWFGTMGNLKWYIVNFPKPEKLQKDMESSGFKTIVITEPYMFQSSINFNDVFNKKLFVNNEKGEEYIMPFWGKKPASLLDFTNADTQKWFGEKVKAIHQTGVDGWWTDLNEPENEMDDMVYELGPKESAHNLEGFLMNKSIHDMYEKEFPNERCFMMSRSGFSGSQRWGTSVWSGDVTASWAHLRAQIPIAINTSLSGLALWNSDTGGFHQHPSPELYTRWIQFSAFTPIFRSHGNHDVREPWSFGEQAEVICKKYIDLRMRLVPYLYSLFYESSKTGAPIMRPTFMEAPGEDIELAGQYFYGHELLVAPVTDDGAKKKTVTLPAGRWTYFWDDRVVEGPKRISVPVDLSVMPIFVRDGAIIPMAPVMQYTREKPVDPLTINYYPSTSASSYNLYEDDGESNAYLNNSFAITHIEAVQKDKSVVIKVGKPGGAYKGMTSKRAYEIVIHRAPGDGVLTAQGFDKKPESKLNTGDMTYIIHTPATGEEFTLNVEFK